MCNDYCLILSLGHGYPPHPASGMTHGYMSGGRPSGYPPHHPNLVQYPSRFSGSSVRVSLTLLMTGSGMGN